MGDEIMIKYLVKHVCVQYVLHILFQYKYSCHLIISKRAIIFYFIIIPANFIALQLEKYKSGQNKYAHNVTSNTTPESHNDIIVRF